MRRLYGDVILVIGASSGMGKAIAQELSQEGYKVYGTSRKAVFPHAAPERNLAGGFIQMIPLDVCSEDSVRAGFDYVVGIEGHIDILINCAGYAIAGAIEDTTPEEAYREFNTNFFGAHRVCRNIAPIMRKQGRGLIINISSVAGLVSIPFQSFYSASKYALDALTEALRLELKPFGVQVSLISPGDTKTEFTKNRVFAEGAAAESAYAGAFKRSVDRMIKDEQNGPPPDGIVRAVRRIINSKNPPVRIVVGPVNKLFAFLLRILPSRLISYIVGKMYA
jgi:short-subunit dehydrogenase